MRQLAKFFSSSKTIFAIGGVLVVALIIVGGLLLWSQPSVEAKEALNIPSYQPQAERVALGDGALASTEEVTTVDGLAQAPASFSTSRSATSGPAANDLSANAPSAVNGGALIYSADVQAAQKVPVAVEVSGRVITLPVEVADAVKAGDVLVQIDSTSLEAQRSQALAGLKAAQAQMAQLQLGPDAGNLEAARAGVSAASAAYQKALDGPTQQDLDIAEAQLRQAEAAVKQAQAAYDQVSWAPNIGALPQSVQLEQATLQAEAARAQYEKLTQGATQDVIDGAYANVAAANAKLESLQEGAKQPQIDAAQAQIDQAESALYMAQLQVNKATLRSPVDGVISKVNTEAGANVAPGAATFEILSNEMEIVLAVEENRLADVYAGQPATISVNAYPGRSFTGEVATIAPELDRSTRTVQVTVRPTGDANGLMPGMYATVALQGK